MKNTCKFMFSVCVLVSLALASCGTKDDNTVDANRNGGNAEHVGGYIDGAQDATDGNSNSMRVDSTEDYSD